ncbi:MAG: glycosyltransferase family 39 protein [Cyanobacteria bacterium P01_F01_bin.116]
MGLVKLETANFQTKVTPQSQASIWNALRVHPNSVILLLIAINLAITIPLAAVLNIWFDEAYSLNTSSQNLGYALSQSMHFEEQAPLYFILLTLWRSLNNSIFFARLFSALCIALTIYVATLISRKLFEDLHPGWIAAMLAFNPISVWAALEVRLYAFSILLSSLLTLLFFEGYLKQKPGRSIRWLYILLATLSLYTHYFLGFVLLANALVLLFLGRLRAFRAYFFDMAISGFLFLPWIFVVVKQFAYLSDTYLEDINETTVPFANSLKMSLGGILKYILPGANDVFTSGWRLLRVIGLSILLFLIFRKRKYIQKRDLAIWLITIISAAVFFVAFEVIDVMHFRHTSVIFLLSQLSVLAVFYLIKGAARKKILSIWLTVTLLLNVFSLTINYSPLAKNGDYVDVASYIMSHEEQRQTVLVFSPEVGAALEPYYKGVNQLVSLPRKEDFKTFDYADFILKDEQEIEVALSQMPDSYRYLWLIVDTGLLKNMPVYQQSYQVLNEFVDKYYTIEVDQEFHGSNVKLLRRIQSEQPL